MAILDALLSLSDTFPKPGNESQAERGMRRFLDAGKALEYEAAVLHESLKNDMRGIALLKSLFGNSPYLSQLLLKHVPFFYRILDNGFEKELENIINHVERVPSICLKPQGVMSELRVAKQKASLLIALADISGAWGVKEVTHTLSQFAEAALCAAVDFLLLQADQKGELSLPDRSNPSKDSGLLILAMGKLGGYELNYSSDIDIVIFFDGEKSSYSGSRDVRQFFIRLVHDLVKIMQERTHDGYVFRTDLRLRPDPGSTPVAISVTGALNYYESLGQNWERAAMIKARPVAGDRVSGEKFLQQLIPYVWRKYLDFASIQDIHSIKRQKKKLN